MINSNPTHILTARELEVLQLIYEGNNDWQIADSLDISKNTSRKHRENLRKKFGVKNTPAMICMAVHLGIVNNFQSNYSQRKLSYS